MSEELNRLERIAQRDAADMIMAHLTGDEFAVNRIGLEAAKDKSMGHLIMALVKLSPILVGWSEDGQRVQDVVDKLGTISIGSSAMLGPPDDPRGL